MGFMEDFNFRAMDIFVVSFALSIFIRVFCTFVDRYRQYRTKLDLFGCLSSASAMGMAIVSLIHIIFPSIPCDARTRIVMGTYFLANTFLFSHFFVKSRLLVGLCRTRWSMPKFWEGKARRGQTIPLRTIDICFLFTIVAFIAVFIPDWIAVRPIRSAATGLCAVQHDDILRAILVALICVNNVMCFLAFVVPLIQLRVKKRLGSQVLDKQTRLIRRTSFALLVSMISTPLFYLIILLIQNKAQDTVSPYYVDLAIVQWIQTFAILPAASSNQSEPPTPRKSQPSQAGSGGLLQSYGAEASVNSLSSSSNQSMRISLPIHTSIAKNWLKHESQAQLIPEKSFQSYNAQQYQV